MNVPLKIEKGIKVPPATHGRVKGSGVYTQTLVKMKQGDSIVVPTASQRSSVLFAASQLKCKVVSRREEDGSGYRIWKV